MTQEVSLLAALKQLQPIWRIGVIEESLGSPPDEIKELQTQLKSKCMKEAATLAQTLDMPGTEQMWAQTYLASHIAKMIADEWPEHREQALKKNYAQHLAALATEPMYAGLPATWHNSAAEVGYVATALNAMSQAMQAYNDYNLLHFDQAAIYLFFQEKIIRHAQESAARVVTIIPEGTSRDSFSSLYQSFLKHSGSAMKDVWRSEGTLFLNAYVAADPDTKLKMKRTGGDLLHIGNRHKQAMDSLAGMAIESLAAAQQQCIEPEAAITHQQTISLS